MGVQKKIRKGNTAGFTAEELMARALARGEMAKQSILRASGELLTEAQAASQLNVEAGEIERMREGSSLIGIPIDGSYRYPSWQFQDGNLLPGLEDILHAIPVRDPWMYAGFFVGTNSYLQNKSPLAELKKGQLDAVMRAARSVGEHGAA